MFKNIYYDFRTNKITLIETIDGKDTKYEDYVEHYYYVEDKTNTSEIKDIYGNCVTRQTTNERKTMKTLADTGVKCYETDLPVDMKFLQERYKGETLVPDIKSFNIGYLDIEIAVEDEFPKPEEAKYPINLISIKSSKTGQMYTFATEEYTSDSKEYVENYAYVPDELEMLTKFVKFFRKMKFDIITGWNVLSFDIAYIINRIKNLTKDGLELKLSPLNKINENYISKEYSIAGLAVLDYLELYKNFTFDTKPSYTLQAIGMHEVGEGKLELEGGVFDIYKTDWNRFADYNIQDVLLVEKIEKKMKFLELTISTCYESLVPLEKVFSSVSTITGYIARHLHEHNMVMPNKQSGHYDWWKHEGMFRCNGELQNVKVDDKETTFEDFAVKGGHCYAKPGFYKYNMSEDAESLYPNNIIMYNISPETKVCKPTEEQIKNDNLIESCINGVYYKSEKGVLPIVVDRIFTERKKFKKMASECYAKGDKDGYTFYDSQQMIRKILINSMYGVLANKHFHFYDVDNARAITRAGRVAIKYLAKCTNEYFANNWHKVGKKYFPNAPTEDKILKPIVCVIDTDSNYFNFEEVKEKYAPEMEFLEFAEVMEHKFLAPFIKKIFDIFAKKRNAINRMNFQREGIITKQFVLAKKKYITELLADEDKVFDPPKIKVKGVETVRSSTPAYNRKHIMSVIQYIFDTLDKEKVLDLLRDIRKDFKKQDISEISSVSGIREYSKYAKPTSHYLAQGLSYKKGTPQHAKASMCYNWMIKNYNYPYMEIGDGTKLKYIQVNPQNIVKTHVIAYVGNWPAEFDQHFQIDKNLQYEKTFLSVIDRMFEVLDWGKLDLKQNMMDSFIS